MLNRLRILSELSGVSGNETDVRCYIESELTKLAEVSRDSMGNLYAHKPGKGAKVAVFVHMDEPGFIVRAILQSGFLAYEQCGLDARTVIAKRITIGPNHIPGVTGIKAIHLIEKSNIEKKPEHKSIYFDIGARNKEEAEKLVGIGDYACFDTKFEEFGDGLVKGKALSSRAGCAIAMELLKENYDCDFTAVFTVQHGIGHRGAVVATERLKPDFVIVVDGSIASNTSSTGNNSNYIRLNDGVVINFMDGRSVLLDKMVKTMVETAEQKAIKYQIKHCAKEATDSEVVQKMLNGVYTCSITIPCRYMNSPVCLMSMKDIRDCYTLINTYLADQHYKEVIQHA